MGSPPSKTKSFEKKTMAATHDLQFFGKDDLSDIKWSHAVNTKEKLNQILEDENTDMLEADIFLNKPKDIDGTVEIVPVMGHPPCVESNFSFTQWMDIVLLKKKKKGIKLDFKDQEAILPTLEYLKNKEKEINFPVWLNADIHAGPGATDKCQIDGKRFIQDVLSTYPQCTLSLGWTTRRQNGEKQCGYSWAMVKQMFNLLKECNLLNQQLSFPVCAHYLNPSSVVKLRWLTSVTSGTLTVWANREDDPPSMLELLHVRHLFRRDQVVYDLLPDVFQKDFNEYKKEPLTSVLKITEADEKSRYIDILQKVIPEVSNKWEKVVGSPEVLIGSQSIAIRDGLVNSINQYTVNDSRLVDLVGTIDFTCNSEKSSFGVDIFLRVRDTVDLDLCSNIRCYIGADGKIQISVMDSGFKMYREEAILPVPTSSVDFKITDSKNSISISVCPTYVDSVNDTIEKGRYLSVNIGDLNEMEGHIVLKVAPVDDAFAAFESLEIIQS